MAQHPPRLPGADALVTLVVCFAAVALAIGIASAARLLRRSELTALWRLAPVSPTFVTLLPLSSLLAVTSLAIFILGAPFFWILLVVDPSGFVAVSLVACVVAAWATVGTLAALAQMSLSKGPERAAAMAQLLTTPVIVAFGFAVRWTATNRYLIDGPTLLLALLGSAALLPFALASVSRLWLRGLSAIIPPRRSPEVEWGRVRWGRMLLRTPAPLSIAVALPLIAATISTSWAALSICLVAVPVTAMFHLLGWEDACPERLQLAPRALAMKMDLFVKIGMPAVAVSSAVAAVLALRQPGFMLLALGALAGALTIFVSSPRLRGLMQLGVIGFGGAVGISLS